MSLATITAALTTGCSSSSDSGGTTASTTCSAGLCLDVSKTSYSTETCEGSSQSCTYANVFFTLENNEDNITDLLESNVSMTINDKDVGVEGLKTLTSNNGLLVSLLLDRSYSITEASAESNIKDSAVQFIDSLPDEARISLAVFASEPTVPMLVQSDGSESSESGTYNNKTIAKSIVQSYYAAQTTRNSNSLTKIYDSVARWSNFKPTDEDLQRLQSVMVVFTDGSDTASRYYETASAALSAVKSNNDSMKIYAIGLGDDVDEESLNTLSGGQTYLAESTGDLNTVFTQVSNDLGAIWHLKILVSESKYNAKGKIDLEYDGKALSATFDMDTF